MNEPFNKKWLNIEAFVETIGKPTLITSLDIILNKPSKAIDEFGFVLTGLSNRFLSYDVTFNSKQSKGLLNNYLDYLDYLDETDEQITAQKLSKLLLDCCFRENEILKIVVKVYEYK